MNKLLVGGLSLLAVAGICGLINSYNKSPKKNFQDLQSNLGITEKDGKVSVVVNNKENSVQFYNNNRFVLFNKSGKEIRKGTYADGGKKLQVDNMFGGELAEGSSVYENINSII